MCLHGLVIDSTGLAKQHQSTSLGLYLNHKQSNGKRWFKHVNEIPFLYWNPILRQWAVSTPIKDKYCDSCYRSFVNYIDHAIVKLSYFLSFLL